MLERKWPEKYNGPGHVRWAGRIYGSGLTRRCSGGAGRASFTASGASRRISRSMSLRRALLTAPLP